MNATDPIAGSTNGTDVKPKSTPEGMMTAYVSLVIMAVLPIIVGAFKSVKAHASNKKQSEVSFEFGTLVWCD